MLKTYTLVAFGDDGAVLGFTEQASTAPADQVATRLWRHARSEQVATAIFGETHKNHREVTVATLYQWENVFRPTIRAEDFGRLRRCYNKAKAAGHEEFTFRNSKGYPCTLVTSYAGYLLEYLEGGQHGRA